MPGGRRNLNGDGHEESLPAGEAAAGGLVLVRPDSMQVGSISVGLLSDRRSPGGLVARILNGDNNSNLVPSPPIRTSCRVV